MDQLGLPFDAPYPSQPGWKRTATSKAAAEAVKPRAKSLRDQVVDILKTGSFTADEVAAIMNRTVLAIRPRFSEALALGHIEDTGRTRKNASGIKASVWRATGGSNGTI